jgi:hypothetical protein
MNSRELMAFLLAFVVCYGVTLIAIGLVQEVLSRRRNSRAKKARSP